MKRAILVICGMIIWIIIWWILVYYFMNNYNGNGRILELEQNNYISPDQAIIEVVDTIYENEYTNLKITMMKNGSKMNQYNSPIEIKITDGNWTELTTNECATPGNWFYKFADSDLWSKMFQKWLTIKKEWNFVIQVWDLDENILLGTSPITVLRTDFSEGAWLDNYRLSDHPTVEIISDLDSDWDMIWDSSVEDSYDYDVEWNWINKCVNTLPDEAIIEVVDTMYENEFVNFEITMMKSWSKMDNYCSYIAINVVDENWNVLDVNEEYALPYNGYYKFVASDLWSKMFQKWLTIKKEGTFYIEVLDMHDPDEKILWRKEIKVIK